MAFLPKDWKIFRGALLLALFLGMAFSVSVYNYALILFLPPISKSIFSITVVLGLIGTLGYFILLNRWLIPIYLTMTASQRWIAGGMSIVLSILIMFASMNVSKSTSKNIIFLVPDQSVEIAVPAQQTVPNPQVVLLYFTTSAGDVSYNTIDYRGWKRSGSQLTLTDPSSNSFRWTGKVGQKASLVFLRSRQGGIIDVSWGKFTERVDLHLEGKDKYVYNRSYPIPFYASWKMMILLVWLNYFFVLSAMILLVWRERSMLTTSFLSSISSLSSPSTAQSARGNQRAIKERIPEWAIVGALLLSAFVLRALYLGHPYIYVDELRHLMAAKEILSGDTLASVYQRGLYIVTLPVALFTRLFGFDLWAAKLPGVLFNSLAVIPLYLITKKINKKAAILSCILYATSPWVIGVARSVREYAYYPFIFYWITLGMISFIERFPNKFVALRDWRKILAWKYLFLALLLLSPVPYALWIDPSSTFKVILLIYGILFLFLLARFDLANKNNILLLAGASLGFIVLASAYISKQSSILFHPSLNAYPLRYFLPNPEQQWYFDRLTIVFILAFFASTLGAVIFRRHNFVPLFLAFTSLTYLLVFTLFFNRYIRPRYFSSLELWYIPVLGFGFYLIWEATRSIFPRRLALSWLVMLLLIPLTVNGKQILLPALYNAQEGFMPVTVEDVYNFEGVEKFLLSNARPDDVLVTTHYGTYASWRGLSDMKIYRLNKISQEDLPQYLSSVVETHDSGWIVLDRWAAKDLAPLIPPIIGDKRIQDIGKLGDQSVWSWTTNH